MTRSLARLGRDRGGPSRPTTLEQAAPAAAEHSTPGCDDRRETARARSPGLGRQSVGEEKERLAELFLRAQGLSVITRNHRCRYGEIDLVMRDAGVLAFVEVRYRRSNRFGGPAETVDKRKQRRLIAAAGHYLQSHPCTLPCRFDVVAISGQNQIQWIKHAFGLESR